MPIPSQPVVLNLATSAEPTLSPITFVAGENQPKPTAEVLVGVSTVPVTAPLEVTAPAFHTPEVIVPRVVMLVWPTYAAEISITGVDPPVEVMRFVVPVTEVTEPVLQAA